MMRHNAEYDCERIPLCCWEVQPATSSFYEDLFLDTEQEVRMTKKERPHYIVMQVAKRNRKQRCQELHGHLFFVKQSSPHHHQKKEKL